MAPYRALKGFEANSGLGISPALAHWCPDLALCHGRYGRQAGGARGRGIADHHKGALVYLADAAEKLRTQAQHSQPCHVSARPDRAMHSQFIIAAQAMMGGS